MILYCKTPNRKSFVFLEGKNWKAEVQNAVSAKPETIKEFYEKRAKLKLEVQTLDDVVKNPANTRFKTQKQLEGKSKEYNVQSFIGKSGAERKDTLFKILKDYFQNTVGGMNEAQAEKEAYLSLHILAQGNVKVDYVRDDAFVFINDGKISIYRRLRTGLKYRFKDIPIREMKRRGAAAAAPAPAPVATPAAPVPTPAPAPVRAPISIPPATPAPAPAPVAPEPPPDIPPPPVPAPEPPPAPEKAPDAQRIAALEATKIFIKKALDKMFTMDRPGNAFTYQYNLSDDSYRIFNDAKETGIVLKINSRDPSKVQLFSNIYPAPIDIELPQDKKDFSILLNRSLDRDEALRRRDEQMETIKQGIPGDIKPQYETPSNVQSSGDVFSIVHLVKANKLVCKLLFSEDEKIMLEKDGSVIDEGTAEEIAAKITALAQPAAAPAPQPPAAQPPPERLGGATPVDQLSAELSREANVKIKITNRNPNPLEINTIRARAPQMIASIRGALGANRALLDDPDMQLEIYIPPNPVVGNLIDSLAQEIANDLPKDLAQIKLNNAASALGITFTPLEDDIDPKEVISSILQIRAAFSQIDAALRTKAQGKGVKFKLKPSSLIGSTAGYDESSNTISFQFTTEPADLTEALKQCINAALQ